MSPPKSQKENTDRNLIALMTRNPVASNPLMLFFIMGGLFVCTRMKQEVLPEVAADFVYVLEDLKPKPTN